MIRKKKKISYSLIKVLLLDLQQSLCYGGLQCGVRVFLVTKRWHSVPFFITHSSLFSSVFPSSQYVLYKVINCVDRFLFFSF